MPEEARTKRARNNRTPQQWLTIFRKQEASGLGPTTYCKTHGITYSAFRNNRLRCEEAGLIKSTDPALPVVRKQSFATPHPLTAAMAGFQPLAEAADSRALHVLPMGADYSEVVLELPGGIRLTLRK